MHKVLDSKQDMLKTFRGKLKYKVDPHNTDDLITGLNLYT